VKFVSYSKDGGEIRAGLSVDGNVVDLADGAKQIGATLPSNVVEILALGEAGLTIAGDVADAAATGSVPTIPESDVTLKAAVQTPPTIFLLAGNYQSHLIEGGGSAVEKNTVNPRPFIKPTTAIIGTGDPIVIPPDSDTLDYEIEIAAVIGKEGRAISVDDANDYVAGYTVFNDVSARSLKIADGRTERNGDGFFDWLLGKWCDSFAAIGP
jgi:2-keto-4-pentenoate hydratase/2-oxohepta-3-ene-1,7-dioic acid hydratase in catechol pathway